MKIITGILMIMFFVNQAMSKDVAADCFSKSICSTDTIGNHNHGEDSLINLVVNNKTTLHAEEVVQLGEFTKNGFKNLFSKLHYNSSLPYASQVNPNAELYMRDYVQKHSKYLMKMKGWGTPYFNMIDNVLTQYGLPAELKYLAVIESSLDPESTSWVGAAGPWQFMPETARNYGLSVNRDIDERRDYFKSTHAAAKFLLSLYQDFHDWLLVIAAYNGGPGRVYEAIRKSNSTDFWKLQYYLPVESKNHVKKFIATHYIMEGVGTDDAQISASTQNRIVTEKNMTTEAITGKYLGAVIAKNLSMDSKEFNTYNPAFDQIIAETGRFQLMLPAEKMKIFRENKFQILNESVELILRSN